MTSNKKDYTILYIALGHVFAFLLIAVFHYYQYNSGLSYEASDEVQQQFGSLTIASTFIVFIVCMVYLNKFNSKDIINEYGGALIFLTLWFIYVIIGISIIMHEDSLDQSFDESTSLLLIQYFQFIPYLFVINKEIVVGTKVNRVEEIKKEINSRKKSFEQLNKLKDSGIISDEELKTKKREIIRAKIEKELPQTEEFKMILDLKNKNILSQEEFNDKIEKLIRQKLDEDS